MIFRHPRVRLLFMFLWAATLPAAVLGQNLGTAGTLRGAVADPSGAVIPGATAEIYNPVTGLRRMTSTDSSGEFSFSNVPFNPYHLTVTAAGFATRGQDVNLNSMVPISLKINLELAGGKTEVTVTGESVDLIETDPTAHTDVDRALFDKLPLESQSSSISSLITLSSPGVTADSNGLFHGMGDHAQNSFSVDGQPITDQQSKIFSNQISLDSIQSLAVIPGAPPAEFGDKTSVVIVATTRSGLGIRKPAGSITSSYGSFGSATGGFNLAYGKDKWGNFISANSLNTSRFLDAPEFTVIHARGNQQNLFDRVDFKPSDKDAVNLNFGLTRSWFQTPNSYDAQNATAWSGLVVDNGGLGPDGRVVGSQDQRSQIKTVNVAPAWTRLMNANTVFSLGGWWRRDQADYYPSANPFADLLPGLQAQTLAQNRTLTNTGVRMDLSYAKGIHNLKAGVNFQHTFLTEHDSFGIVDPTFNPVCFNADGSPDTDPTLTNPSNCNASLQPNTGFDPLLACYDLTRTANLPASDGCPHSTSGMYAFGGHTDVKEVALFIQDSIKAKNWMLNLGLRGDIYNGITIAREVEPRVGVSYNFKHTNTVLRASYARTMETPFNENLVLASAGCNDPVVNALMTATQGYPCLAGSLHPGTRNEFHAGIEQVFGKHLVVDGEYIWKYTKGAYDFSIFGATPLTFPIVWDHSKIPGYAVRATVPNTHGFTAFVVFSSVAARFFTPQISGIGATPSGAGAGGVFRIDHDEVFNQTTHLQYQPSKRGPWLGFNWRYDSGLAAGPVPCAGGNCNNGPNGTGSVVDFSRLTPDQQFQAGLSCGGVLATPTTPISPTGLCPASQYSSKFIKLPAAGTEDDDHNPPRIAPRNLFDLAVGHDNLFNGDKRKWSFRFTVINLTNKEALYNFLSTFSGTHYVTPRTYTAELALHF